MIWWLYICYDQKYCYYLNLIDIFSIIYFVLISAGYKPTSRNVPNFLVIIGSWFNAEMKVFRALLGKVVDFDNTRVSTGKHYYCFRRYCASIDPIRYSLSLLVLYIRTTWNNRLPSILLAFFNDCWYWVKYCFKTKGIYIERKFNLKVDEKCMVKKSNILIR